MIREQLFLFPEHNHFAQKEKNIDYVYLDELPNSKFSDFDYSKLEKHRFVLWKTGGINPYMKDLGKVFPYLYDNKKQKLKTIRVKGDDVYPRFHLFYNEGNKVIHTKPKMHIIVCRAFVTNPFPNKFHLVHHIDNNPVDYRPFNLQHVNQSINITNTKKTKLGSTHDQYIMNFNSRTTKK
tara:strand:+ start:339 stop:878 length:540 start_codon:yes stop_codon:yes gene_type:complete